MHPLDSPALWLEAAQRGAVIITSNERAARYLRAQANQFYRASGLAGWTTPSILNWNAWLAEAWGQIIWNCADVPVLLSSEQEHALWMQILETSGETSPLAHDALADLAQDAWKLLHDYQLDLTELRSAAKSRIDWETFSDWTDKFQRRTAKALWLTQAQLARELQRRLAAKEWTLPELIVWGFDSFTPAQESLLDSLEQVCKVTRIAPSSTVSPDSATQATSLKLASPADEFRAAARWAAMRLQQNPQSRLAIITTQAAEDRGALQRALSLQLATEQFAFTLGRPPSHFSVVRNAMLLLRFQRGWLTAAEISDLLLAPQLTTSLEEREERSLFEANDFRRREAADPAMDLAIFARWLRGRMTSHSGASLRRLARQCEAALRLLPKTNVRLGAEDWADHFTQALAAFEYPAATQSSVEYQTWERWQQLQQAFSGTSISGETLAHQEAVARLGRLASKTIFQPEAGDAAVEIMGPLEAAGSLFDGIFFTGCTDQRWPISLQPNPLLPLPLQRAAGMPGAVPGATLDRALQMTQRILLSAPEILFSHAERDQDGDLRQSPVFARLRLPQADDAFRRELCPVQSRKLPALTTADDTFGPPFPADGSPQPTSALRDQAACPFRSFALHRLHARGEELPEEGFDAQQRGKLLHEALRNIWSGPEGLNDSETLHEMIQNDRLSEFVTQRIDEVTPENTDGWQREFFRIERGRLSGLICDWLIKVEAQRSPFQVVHTEKELVTKPVVSLKFNVRLDRVDQLIAPHDAEHPADVVLLDYKSGRLDSKVWDTPKMDEPQLPLYALFAFSNVPAAVAFGQIRAGEEPSIRGAASRPEILPGRQDISDEQQYAECLAEWRNDLEDLAKKFVAGDAAVDPKYREKTCRYCTLEPLCRVHETDALLDQDEDEFWSSAND